MITFDTMTSRTGGGREVQPSPARIVGTKAIPRGAATPGRVAGEEQVISVIREMP